MFIANPLSRGGGWSRPAPSADGASAGSHPLVSSPGGLTWFAGVEGERIAIHLDASQTAGAYAIMEAVAQPGAAAPMHYHREEEVFLVVDGVMTYMVGEDVVQAEAGTVVRVPAGAHHAWINRSGIPVRSLAIFLPGGVEALFRTIGGKPIDEIATLAAEYGTVVTGPPPA